MRASKPVLLLGGSGLVGAETAAALQALAPELRLVIGGRDRAKAERVAAGLRGGSAASVELGRPDLGLPADATFGAVIMFVKDERSHALPFAQAQGAAYVDISTGPAEVAPEIAWHTRAPGRSAILLAGHWLAGVATLSALHFAAPFRRLHALRIGAVLDELDLGGPAAYADYARLTGAGPRPVALREGQWVTLAAGDIERDFAGADGHPRRGQAYATFDLMSLAAATAARDLRVDLVVGESAGRRGGGPFSTEMVFELEGELADGTRAEHRHEVTHPRGQAPLTALSVALGVERLLGLDGRPPAAPGLYLPNTLLEPAAMMQKLRTIGARVEQLEPRRSAA